ncbi:MAG: hypothetical protein MK066_04230 [Crocinitomicaceae bacterium]|nr:hypothetical protein [Crocinitomicaceae bacterium]
MKRWLMIGFWALFAVSTIVLMVTVQRTHAAALVSPPEIVINAKGDAFVTKVQLAKMLQDEGLIRDFQSKEEVSPEKIEEFIGSISQVKSAEVFMRLGSEWRIEVELKKPLARIYNKYDETFYLDEDGDVMSTTPAHTARVLVVTGEIYDRRNGHSVKDIINNDSLKSILKLDEIYRISGYVCHDPVMCSLIGQLHVEKNGDLILVPLVGDFKIIFGSADSEEEVKAKFEKLRIFYKEGMPNVGWNKYTEISLKYRDQIVCRTKPTVASGDI